MRLGQELNSAAVDKFSRNSPTPRDIFENMEELNEEIENAPILEEDGTFHSRNSEELQREPVQRPVQSKRILVPKEREVSRGKRTQQESDFSKDLKSVKTVDTVSQKAPVKETEEESDKDKLYKMLAKINGPTEKQIEALKTKYGTNSAYITVFSDKEIYIYTHLTRTMWTEVQSFLKRMQETKDNVAEEELKEVVVKHCVLWPSLGVEWKYSEKAGVVGSLYDSIMFKSYFLTPQQVQMITMEL